jgi:predicted dehydrogenase
MRIALLGCAHVHAQAYARRLAELPDVTFTGIFDPDSREPPDWAWSGVRAIPGLDEAIASADAVVIASATSDHRRLAAAAAHAGRHVLCEKPLATTIADATAMVATARDAGVVLATAFPMRFAPAVSSAWRAVRAGTFGQILAFSGANNGQMPPPAWFADPVRAGGGAVMDHTVHLADLMRWFVQDEIAEVYAEVDTLLHDIRVDDVGVLSVRFAGGAIGTIDASWNRPARYPSWGGLELRIVAEEGVIDIDAFAQRLTTYGSHGATWVGWGSDADRAMLQAFVQTCRGQETRLASGEDGLAALRIVIMAYDSARTHAPVCG